MPTKSKPIMSVDAYLKAVAPDARRVLKRIRTIVKSVAPQAEEVVSYRLPAFRQGRVFIYFAAFKTHIGIYPPVKGDAALNKALQPYRGPKGNLKFPLDRPMPYELIERVAKALAREYSRIPSQSAEFAKRSAGEKDMSKIEIENVNHPGSVQRVDTSMYQAMKRAYLALLPAAAPGLTVAEIHRRLMARLPQNLYPEGAKSGWWAKAVQLDLEAKGVIKRVKTSSLRLYPA